MLATGMAALACALPATATAKAKHPTAAERVRVKRALTREVRRNPGVVLKRRFLKKASFVDFKLPLTVRLGRSNGMGGYEASDDAVEIDWDDAVVPWPLPGGMPAATQTTFLSGRFTLEASLGDDTGGYGELGALETVQGMTTQMTATPFT